MQETEPLGYFVYLYRDTKSGNPFYVGEGGEATRALSHTGRGHNPALTSRLKEPRAYSIEIAGPFGDRETATLVEGALISALRKHLLNVAPGRAHSNFRPLGVPVELADRSIEAPLTEAALKRLTGRRPALIVYLSSKNFIDRPGIDLANPRTDAEIEERMDHWWQLNSQMSKWRGNRSLVPAILIAVSGTPAHRVVVGSAEIDAAKPLPWESKPEGGGFYRVPLSKHNGLDFGSIRGRRVDQTIATFGGVPSQFFKIV